MIVDDEAYALDLLLESIDWASLGLCVTQTALNGYQGYNKFIVQPVDIIISDIRMPIMSGIEMAEKIRSTGKDVQIIFVSSYEEFEYAKKAIDIDVVGYVLKPVDDAYLIRTLQQAGQRIEQKKRLREHDFGAGAEVTNVPDGDAQIIEDVKRYIRDNVKERLVLREVAEHFMYSANYLGKLFKKETGLYFNDFVTRAKMERAKQLLRVPQNHIGDVAQMLGYGQMAYFTKQFKDYCGMTPKAYQNRNKGK